MIIHNPVTQKENNLPPEITTCTILACSMSISLRISQIEFKYQFKKVPSHFSFSTNAHLYPRRATFGRQTWILISPENFEISNRSKVNQPLPDFMITLYMKRVRRERGLESGNKGFAEEYLKKRRYTMWRIEWNRIEYTANNGYTTSAVVHNNILGFWNQKQKTKIVPSDFFLKTHIGMNVILKKKIESKICLFRSIIDCSLTCIFMNIIYNIFRIAPINLKEFVL